MYKWLLCWRYLQTRYLALACIVSVMLGVATLIVVNSVMSGFSTKLRERLHALLSDVVIEAMSMEGFHDPNEKMERIRNDPFLRDRIAAMTPTLECYAMIQFPCHGEDMKRLIRLIGIDPASRAQVGGFSEYLIHQANSQTPSFEVSEELRRLYFWRNPPLQLPAFEEMEPVPGEPPPPIPPPSQLKIPRGLIVGNAIASIRAKNAKSDSNSNDITLLDRGDTVSVFTLSGGKMAPVYDKFIVTDYFKSEMSEYDSNYVFAPLDYLQTLLAMPNRVTSLQLKLKNYDEAPAVLAALGKLFPSSHYQVQTWEHKQGPLLAAISIEKGILNVLLFLIIGVAGFGILAIFSMIVVEKTRDIGILKALGASNAGVMKIFLTYGLLLGLIGAVLGTAMGLSFTAYINEIEQALARMTGQDVFDRSVYYFDKIPTYIQTATVVGVNVGAVLIAVMFSVLPSLRAALLHPVKALRYE